MADLAENTSVGMSEVSSQGINSIIKSDTRCFTTVRELAERLSGRRDQLEYVALISRISRCDRTTMPTGWRITIAHVPF